MEITLNETFDQFRFHCGHRKYYQRHTNAEYEKLGGWGVDPGNIKCVHPKALTCWCKEGNTAENCPRLKTVTKVQCDKAGECSHNVLLTLKRFLIAADASSTRLKSAGTRKIVKTRQK